MSAYMVSKQHINALVHAACFGPRDLQNVPFHARTWYRPSYKGFQQWGFDLVNDIGEMLTKENLSSIHARYPDTETNPEATPGPVDLYWLQPYQYTPPSRPMNAIEALKALDCYEYQSCEHPEWERSEAKQLCDSMRHSLIGFLPGYEAAPWEWDAA